MRVYIATTNAGKLREFREILGRSGWQVETFAGYGDVEEDETTYAGNAALKARALRDDLRRTKELAPAGVLGDDSGLEVAALGGAPGVRSARFRSELPWPERRAALLADLAETPAAGRAARFVCALHYIDVAGREFAVEGEVRGRVATREAGEGGFSYDPIFEYEPDGKTFAELSESRKNSISHRACAVAALLRLVMRRGPAAGKTGSLREAARDGT